MLTYFTLFFFRGDVGGWVGVEGWGGGAGETTESADAGGRRRAGSAAAAAAAAVGYEPETKMI